MRWTSSAMEGCPAGRLSCFLRRPPFLPARLRPSSHSCGLVVGVWSGTGGNPWSSAAARTMATPWIGVGYLLGGLVEVPSLPSSCILVAKAPAPLEDGGGVLSSHPFLEAPSGVHGSKVGVCCRFGCGWWRLSVHLLPPVFVVQYFSSARVWMCGWLCLWRGRGSAAAVV